MALEDISKIKLDKLESHSPDQIYSTLKLCYKTVYGKTVLDTRQFKGVPHKCCIDDLEK